MIWGMTLHPGVAYTRKVTSEETLTLASMDCRPRMNTGEHPVAHLLLKRGQLEYVVCTLEKGIIHQQRLDFVLEEGEDLTLLVEGTSLVHITGYTWGNPPYASAGIQPRVVDGTVTSINNKDFSEDHERTCETGTEDKMDRREEDREDRADEDDETLEAEDEENRKESVEDREEEVDVEIGEEGTLDDEVLMEDVEVGEENGLDETVQEGDVMYEEETERVNQSSSEGVPARNGRMRRLCILCGRSQKYLGTHRTRVHHMTGTIKCKLLYEARMKAPVQRIDCIRKVNRRLRDCPMTGCPARGLRRLDGHLTCVHHLKRNSPEHSNMLDKAATSRNLTAEVPST